MLPADREVEEGKMIDFKGSHFEKEIILWGVRWWPTGSDGAKTYASALYALFWSAEFCRIRFVYTVLRDGTFTGDPPIISSVCCVQYTRTLCDIHAPDVLYVMI
jgi:hypothetical protein